MSTADRSLRARKHHRSNSPQSRTDATRRHRRLFLEPLEARTVLAGFVTGQPDYYTLDEDTTLNISAPGVLMNDDAAATAAGQPSSPAHGSLTFNTDGSFSYTPTADYYGTDSFTYQATDGTFSSGTITVNLTINDVAEPPPPPTVDAINDSYEVNEDTLLYFFAPGVLSNDQGQSLSATLTSSPAHGSAYVNSDGVLYYQPLGDYNGADTLTYQITDGVSTDSATVTINVLPINDAPVISSTMYLSLDEDTSLTVSAAQLLTYATDVDGDTLTITGFNVSPTWTVVTNYDGTYTFTPSANYNGTDGFSYAVSDGQSSITAVTAWGYFTVNPINDVPVASDRSYSTNEDTQLISYSNYSDSLLGGTTDPDANGNLNYTVVTPPAHGQLEMGYYGSFIYTPAANFSGIDSFEFKASDGQSYSNVALATISVTEINDTPDAVEDFFTFDEDALYAPGSLFGNDTDVEGATLTASLVMNVSNGNLILNSNGTFNYTPYAN